jgi:hypothetical protein
VSLERRDKGYKLHNPSNYNAATTTHCTSTLGIMTDTIIHDSIRRDGRPSRGRIGERAPSEIRFRRPLESRRRPEKSLSDTVFSVAFGKIGCGQDGYPIDLSEVLAFVIPLYTGCAS